MGISHESARSFSLLPPFVGWVGGSEPFCAASGVAGLLATGTPFLSWSVVVCCHSFSFVSVSTLDHRGLEFAGLPLGPPASHLGNDCLGRVVLSFQFVLSVLPGDMTVWATGTLDTNSGQRGLDLGVNFGGLTI